MARTDCLPLIVLVSRALATIVRRLTWAHLSLLLVQLALIMFSIYQSMDRVVWVEVLEVA